MNAIQRTLLHIAVAAGLAMTAGAANAILLSDLNAGGTITVGDKLFSNWSVSVSGTTPGSFADIAAIDVTGLPADPLNPGLKFTAATSGPAPALGTPFGHGGSERAVLDYSFTVSTLSGLPLIKDNDLELTDFIFDAGQGALITIDETVLTALGGTTLASKSVFAESIDQPNSGDPDHFDSANFAPQASVFVSTRVVADGPGINDGVVVSMWEQHFSQLPVRMPEPASGLLVLLGLAGLRLGRCTKRA